MIGSGIFEAVCAVVATTAGFKDTDSLLIGNPDFKSGNNFLSPLIGFVLFSGTPQLPSQLLRRQRIRVIRSINDCQSSGKMYFRHFEV